MGAAGSRPFPPKSTFQGKVALPDHCLCSNPHKCLISFGCYPELRLTKGSAIFGWSRCGRKSPALFVLRPAPKAFAVSGDTSLRSAKISVLCCKPSLPFSLLSRSCLGLSSYLFYCNLASSWLIVARVGGAFVTCDLLSSPEFVCGYSTRRDVFEPIFSKKVCE